MPKIKLAQLAFMHTIIYTVIQKAARNTLSYNTVISQRFLPKVNEMFEKVRDCEQQLNPRATRPWRTRLTL